VCYSNDQNVVAGYELGCLLFAIFKMLLQHTLRVTSILLQLLCRSAVLLLLPWPLKTAAATTAAAGAACDTLHCSISWTRTA
jgi:hypothetical protein